MVEDLQRTKHISNGIVFGGIIVIGLDPIDIKSYGGDEDMD